MKISTRLFVGLAALTTMIAAHASIPMWRFTPLTATSLVLFTNTTAAVQYTITNFSKRTHVLTMVPITGISQDTSAGNCSNPFILGYLQSCTLSLQITANSLSGSVAAGPVVCDQSSTLQCYQPELEASLNLTVTPPPPIVTTTLTPSISTLALSVHNPSLNAALTGNPRSITITNTGAITATNVFYTLSTVLPSGATITPATCGTMLPGATCTLTITPGTGATTAPITITVQGDQTNTLALATNIVTYGTSYQGGFVFSVNDTTANTGSIGGKVAAPSDQVVGIIWSSTGTGSYDGGVSIFGIDELSSALTPSPSTGQITGQTGCAGASDGLCDTKNIFTWYTTPNTSPAIPTSFYAAGICTTTINGFTDWYLPAVCELGYGSASGCGTSGAPAIQNMASSLVDNAVSGVGLAGNSYWASTEYSATPQTTAWSETFVGTVGSSTQIQTTKSSGMNVRCARGLT